MRTQPQVIIKALEDHPSRLNKEAILKDAMEQGLDEFFEGVRWALDKLYTFGVKQVPVSKADGQGLDWASFTQLANSLRKRELTGHDARDAIKLAMDVATMEQWNGWYRRILIKDLRCGVSEKTVNSVAKDTGLTQYRVPVFECMLAHDGANHEKKIQGVKLLEPKLDGVRCITVVDAESRTVTQFTRNGKILENFTHITEALARHIDDIGRSYVLDGEVVSSSFQALMKQVHRKDNVQADDARLMLFDIVPLSEFRSGKSIMGQRRRTNLLRSMEALFNTVGHIDVIPQIEVDLETAVGRIEYKDYNKQMVEGGFEGIMIKDPDAAYVAKRDAAWLKQKPFIEVSLEIVDVEEGTGRNEGKLGALVCSGQDDGKTITVNVGSGFSDSDRDEFWLSRSDIIGQVVEVRADAVTQNQDGSYSLRFPRFLRFRGFKKGEKI
jgi:DNA ligase-1